MSASAIYPQFSPGEIVHHITDDTSSGVVTAFMVRGHNHSYEVQWGIDKCNWHLSYEITRVPDPPKPIGFWSPDGK